MSRRHLHLPLRHSTARKRIPNHFWLLDIRTKSGSSRSHRNRRETVEVTSRLLLRAIYSRKKLMRIRYAQTPHSRVWSRHYIFLNREPMRWASQDDIFTPAWGVTSKKYSVFHPHWKMGSPRSHSERPRWKASHLSAFRLRSCRPAVISLRKLARHSAHESGLVDMSALAMRRMWPFHWKN